MIDLQTKALKEAWQNRHLEQEEDHRWNCISHMDDRQLIPHLW